MHAGWCLGHPCCAMLAPPVPSAWDASTSGCALATGCPRPGHGLRSPTAHCLPACSADVAAAAARVVAAAAQAQGNAVGEFERAAKVRGVMGRNALPCRAAMPCGSACMRPRDALLPLPGASLSALACHLLPPALQSSLAYAGVAKVKNIKVADSLLLPLSTLAVRCHADNAGALASLAADSVAAVEVGCRGGMCRLQCSCA